MKNKVNNIILITGFCFIMILPLFNINRIKNFELESEKRIAANFPIVFNEEGDFVLEKSDFELWLNDNIGYREEFVKLNSFINTDVFNISLVSSVYLGLNDWYYYKGDQNLNIAEETYELNDVSLEMIKHNQQEISDYYKSLDIEYYLIIPPSKVSIYPENILLGLDYVTSPSDILEDALSDTDVNYINLKDDLIEAKDDYQVYFKTDTHWNNYGVYVGYKEIINIMNENEFFSETIENPVFSETEISGDLSTVLYEDDKEVTLDVDISNGKYNELLEGNLIYNEFNIRGKTFYNEDKNKNLLIYGDSFTGGCKFDEFLSTHFKETNFLWTDKINKNHLYDKDIDVVIFEITERYIYRLTSIRINF